MWRQRHRDRWRIPLEQRSRAGDLYANPKTGEVYWMVEAYHETGGKALICEMIVHPGGAAVEQLMHKRVDLHFTVHQGLLSYAKGSERGIIGPGEALEIPAGTVHDWFVAGDEPAIMRATATGRADRFEQLIVHQWGLAHDGKTNAHGASNLRRTALVLRTFRDDLALDRPRTHVRAALLGLATLARLSGMRAWYPHHVHVIRTRNASREQWLAHLEGTPDGFEPPRTPT